MNFCRLSDPYWIPFGEDEYAQVTEVCKVPVSMGKFYKEEITCHVIDMDDTNVLFGRPWHESVKGGYCKDNTYLFRWESHKIKIKPRRKNIKNDHPEVCEKEHEEATLKIEEKLIKDKEADSFITSISMSCMPNCVQDQPKEKSLPIPFQVEEFKFQDAYSKLVYGIGFMVIPFNFENIEVDGLSCFIPTNDRAAYKRNSRSSSFQVEETDVGRDFSQFQQRIGKRKKRLHIKKNNLNIGNWYSNRLLNDGINHKLLFWIYRDSRTKSWLGFQLYICWILAHLIWLSTLDGVSYYCVHASRINVEPFFMAPLNSASHNIASKITMDLSVGLTKFSFSTYLNTMSVASEAL
ncbi:hypothetical protein RchiOBHm_Chr6g0250181 [Rosa chinensis]|uniref:Uncharacterized protein n=1 Tax=Rosa chinensis TaxID=74649 RepID=A0A2P6PKH2_ROSCH|nr:hypothetical protein RchiOBHm_Chr6g0250181 [Rosa chinensis]